MRDSQKRFFKYLSIGLLLSFLLALPLNPFIQHKNMPEIWGLLPKSQIDNELIEQAIARLILEHNNDETAHLGAGQSLQSHKASEIIDHVVASIVADKIAKFSIDFEKLIGDRYMLMTCFESVDGWNVKGGSGGQTITPVIFGVFLQTGTLAGYSVYLAASPTIPGDPVVKFDRDSFFQTTIRCYSTTAQIVYSVLGSTALGYGFKIVDNTLYALHVYQSGGPVEVTTEILGITLNIHNAYRAVFDVAAGEIRFYVNGVLKATHTENLPVGDSSYTFNYRLTSTAAGGRSMEIRDLLISHKI